MSYKNYNQWKVAARTFKSFMEYDEHVYKSVGDRTWHSDPINTAFSHTWENLMNTLLAILSEGKETDFWALHERFDSPGGATGKKPIAWYKTQYNSKEDGYLERKGMGGFIPEQLEKVFKIPERQGYITALSMYKDLVDIETKWRKNEAKTSSSKSKKTNRK